MYTVTTRHGICLFQKLYNMNKTYCSRHLLIGQICYMNIQSHLNVYSIVTCFVTRYWSTFVPRQLWHINNELHIPTFTFRQIWKLHVACSFTTHNFNTIFVCLDTFVLRWQGFLMLTIFSNKYVTQLNNHQLKYSFVPQICS